MKHCNSYCYFVVCGVKWHKALFRFADIIHIIKQKVELRSKYI
jgi:hypothetical protein